MGRECHHRAHNGQGGTLLTKIDCFPYGCPRLWTRPRSAGTSRTVIREVLVRVDRLNDDLDFSGVGQAFVIERHTLEKKTGKTSAETVYGVISHPCDTADAARVLRFNRAHRTIENGCNDILD